MTDSTVAFDVSQAAAPAPLSPPDEARVFWRMRARLTKNLLRQTLTTSRLRLTLLVLASAVLWAGLFWMFADGFTFLVTTIPHPDTHDQTVSAVYRIFFATLMVMLVFSSAIILYSGLYRSAEARFLLTMPAAVERVFLHKFQEAVLFSSWGFLLLGSPMLVAYGVVHHAPWFYFAMLAPFMLAYVFIPCGLGAIACVVIVHRLPSRRRHVLAAAAGLAAVAAAWFGWSVISGPPSDLLTPGWFQSMLNRLRFSEHKLLPSWWLSAGLLQAARRQWSDATLFLAVTAANGLLIHQAAIWTAGRWYRVGYNELPAKRMSRPRRGVSWLDRLAAPLTGLLPREMRLLVAKDLRLFRRDPVQWTQFLIFFGLLGLYFLNTRRLDYGVAQATWINLVSFLNLAVVGLILSTFTTRFVFPMISLEGRRFWVLGLLPVRRETILLSKFVYAAGGSLIPCSLLVLLSDLMLGVPGLIIAVHLLACVILCSGLSGIAVGLGATMPSLREESPSRIAAGFGGTLNLIVSAAYIVVVVASVAAPSHFYVAARQSTVLGPAMRPEMIGFWLAAGIAGNLLLGVVVTAVPLKMGLKAFRTLEV